MAFATVTDGCAPPNPKSSCIMGVQRVGVRTGVSSPAAALSSACALLLLRNTQCRSLCFLCAVLARSSIDSFSAQQQHPSSGGRRAWCVRRAAGRRGSMQVHHHQNRPTTRRSMQQPARRRRPGGRRQAGGSAGERRRKQQLLLLQQAAAGKGAAQANDRLRRRCLT